MSFQSQEQCDLSELGQQKRNLDMLHMKDHHKKYTIIAAISENYLELVAICEWNTNGAVFTQFINELGKKIVEKYGERRKAFILSWDGARNHSTSTVKDKINDIGMTWIQTVPYTPEFLPINYFIIE